MPLRRTPNTDIHITITPNSSATRRFVMVGNGNPANRASGSSVYVGSGEIHTFISPASSSSTSTTNSESQIIGTVSSNAHSTASRMIRTSRSPDFRRVVNPRASQVISTVYPSAVLIMDYPSGNRIMRQIIHQREYWSSGTLTRKNMMKKRNRAQGTFKIQVPPREKVKRFMRKPKKIISSIRTVNDTVHGNEEERRIG
uniref:Uncharacterized protein n=1 Tax=Cacopsylla melanoneura TaxID=428564 RepID=A0A8D8W925_9HEMI